MTLLTSLAAVSILCHLVTATGGGWYGGPSYGGYGGQGWHMKVPNKIIVKHVPKHIHVPKPYPIPKLVPVPKYLKYLKPLAIAKPVPVPQVVPVIKHFQKPFPVLKGVPFHFPIPLPKLVKLPFPIKLPKPYVVHVPKPYAVPKKYPVAVPVHIPKPYVVPVLKSVPVAVPKKVHKVISVVKEVPEYIKKPVPVYVEEKPYKKEYYNPDPPAYGDGGGGGISKGTPYVPYKGHGGSSAAGFIEAYAGHQAGLQAAYHTIGSGYGGQPLHGVGSTYTTHSVQGDGAGYAGHQLAALSGFGSGSYQTPSDQGFGSLSELSGYTGYGGLDFRGSGYGKEVKEEEGGRTSDHQSSGGTAYSTGDSADLGTHSANEQSEQKATYQSEGVGSDQGTGHQGSSYIGLAITRFNDQAGRGGGYQEQEGGTDYEKKETQPNYGTSGTYGSQDAYKSQDNRGYYQESPAAYAYQSGAGHYGQSAVISPQYYGQSNSLYAQHDQRTQDTYGHSTNLGGEYTPSNQAIAVKLAVVNPDQVVGGSYGVSDSYQNQHSGTENQGSYQNNEGPNNYDVQGGYQGHDNRVHYGGQGYYQGQVASYSSQPGYQAQRNVYTPQVSYQGYAGSSSSYDQGQEEPFDAPEYDSQRNSAQYDEAAHPAGYGSQSSGSQSYAESPAYQAQSSGYQAESNGYQAQSNGYQVQSNGYQAQSNNYQVQDSGIPRTYGHSQTDQDPQEKSYDSQDGAHVSSYYIRNPSSDTLQNEESQTRTDYGSYPKDEPSEKKDDEPTSTSEKAETSSTSDSSYSTQVVKKDGVWQIVSRNSS